MPWQLYFLSNTALVCFLTEVHLKFFQQFLRKNADFLIQTDKRDCQLFLLSKILIVSSRLFLVIITPEVLKFSTI